MKTEEIKGLLLNLIKIPSITGSAEEDECASYIYNWLSKLKYFQDNPEDLIFRSTPVEGEENSRQLHSVAAFMKAKKATSDTVVLIGHLDVVDVECYGDLKRYAFDPVTLSQKLSDVQLPNNVSQHLKSGDYIFGRGCMDMKCGVAIEMSLLADFNANRELFDVNVLMLAVADEEANASGMRGMVSLLKELKDERGLNYRVVINTEPSDAAIPGIDSPAIFTGTIGKLLPVFYFVGKEAHVGNYYTGMSASLMMSELVSIAEAAPELADGAFDEVYPSWANLESKIIKEGYNVTVPNRSVAYFNCFTVTKTPAQVLSEMISLANRACKNCQSKLLSSYQSLRNVGYLGERSSDWNTPVKTYNEIYKLAKANYNGNLDVHINKTVMISKKNDLREKGIVVIEEMLKLSGLIGPLVIVGFLPPYLPHRSTRIPNPQNEKIMNAVNKIISIAQIDFKENMLLTNYFTGLCDLSYTGFEGNADDLVALADNLPAWGKLYYINIDGILSLDNIPIINIGPKGMDAHKNTERVEVPYSLSKLPQILTKAINVISNECK